MPVLLETLTPQHIAAFRGGDERAFERVVRTRYDHLCDRALMALPAEASSGAPRVAIGALHAAWSAHERFTDESGLDAFLEEAVSAAATEEARRRASLHRFEKHEGVQHVAHATTRPSVDDVWADLHAALHVTEADRQRHREEARRAARAHTREHVDRVASRKVPWAAIAFGAVAVVAIFAAMQWIDRSSADSVLTQAINASEARTLATQAGQFGTLTLNDNSTARMGAQSALRVPANFPQPARGLQLTGTAFFTVAPGLAEPFQVRVGDARLTATGTAFGVRKFPEETEIVVRVDEGTVVATAANGTERSLTAGQSLVIGADGTMRDATEADLIDAFSWMDGRLVLRDLPLEQALPALARWFDLDLELGDASLASRPISAELPLESSGQALDLVLAAGKLRMQFNDKQMVLYDAPEPAGGNAKK